MGASFGQDKMKKVWWSLKARLIQTVQDGKCVIESEWEPHLDEDKMKKEWWSPKVGLIQTVQDGKCVIESEWEPHSDRIR